MSIKAELNNLRETFILFEDPKDKFVQLMDMAKKSDGLSKMEKIDPNKIDGCTSQAWVVADSNDDGTYTFRADSDALIVRGLLTILERTFSGQPTDEILAMNSDDILHEVGLDNSITSQRTNGFSSAIVKIQDLVR
jgi:cysteine desulfuration protein SufE|tara:strand:- start:389 stop:796 length:408 start_codon:yes stop_codon:yes gene_type:complete